ncbi:MAG TPA: PAS domain S-box protein [Chloroflexota bacterium]
MSVETTGAPPQRAEDPDLFRLFVEQAVDYAICLLTSDGLISSWNAGAERLRGYTADEIVGQSFDCFYTDEELMAGLPGQLLETARLVGRVQDQGWRVRKDGSRFWADVVITALRDERGTLRGFANIARDLSERQVAISDLRDSEQRYTTLVDSIKDYAIFMLSPEGRVLTWNQGAQRLKGYARNEIIGQSFERFYTDEARAARRPAHLLGVAATEGRVEDEGWRVRKDGSRFWADVVITALRDERGELIGFAKVTRDLTERREAEQDRAARLAAERAAERFERLQVATAALAAASRPESAAEVLTDVAVRALGATGCFVTLSSADDPTAHIAAVSGSPFDAEPGRGVPFDRLRNLTTFVASPGEAWAAVPLILKHRVLGILALSFDEPRALDMDERGFLLALGEVGAQAMDRARLYAAEELARKEAEAAEQAARDEAQLVDRLHAVSLALLAELDLDRVVQAVTNAATLATGAAFGSLVYETVDERSEPYTLHTLADVSGIVFEDSATPRSAPVFDPTMPFGDLPVLSAFAVPVVSRAGQVLGRLFFGHYRPGVFGERSERLAVGIAAQAAIAIDNARLYQQVQQALQTRDEFLAAAAHDLKTPLASTKGTAQLLRKRIEGMQVPESERITSGLRRIDQSVDRMTDLIDELLDLGRLQLGQPLDLDRAPVDLAHLLQQVVADQQPNAPRHTFRVTSDAEPIVGTWDVVRLRRVFDNLVSNAVKYSPDGGEVLVHAESALRPDGRGAVIQVTDHGVGIPAADQPFVFERFRRGRNVAFAHGTGIGLAVSQSIVQLHGGSIHVDSVEGKGSTFTVRLPLS